MKPVHAFAHAVALVALTFGCVAPAPTAPPDADAGEAVDAGEAADAGVDAGADAGEAVDAGADAGEAVDAGADAGADAGEAADAGSDAGEALDGGASDAGWTPDGPVATRANHWRLTFVDDFKGKTGAPDDAWCFDQLPAQCSIWPGADTNDCDLADVLDPGMIPPLKENLAAALGALDASRDWNAASEADVRSGYAALLGNRLKDLNKCTWSMYEMVNWMATDYADHWSARMDPSRVTVDTSGKGYLQLSAAYAPVHYDCVYGGNLGGPNCQVYGFAAGALDPAVKYWAETNPAYPGVYHAASAGTCRAGEALAGPNCLVHAFPPHFLDEHGPAYWVDPNPAYPGVYYANETYRCRDNIDYSPSFGFRNLTCPILDGAMLSMPAANRAADAGGAAHPRGFTQHEGRFEVKARIPKGLGAFPAAWLLPIAGGWPYDGGEIDILEARDNADETYHTYHSGKCYDPASSREVAATDSADCATKGGQSVHLDKGFTARERDPGEFWTRDHVFSVEWLGDHLEWFVNGASQGVVTVGTTANLDPTSAPASLASYEASNFPARPFYWILNHSTYVAPDKVSGWAEQTFLVDYVKTYAQCTRNAEFCPCGGQFREGDGCLLAPAEPLHCPAGVAAPAPRGVGLFQSACAPADESCPNGGTRAGTLCFVKQLDGLSHTVRYWVDADPRWPGVYYAPTSGQHCDAGGRFTGVNCQFAVLPGDLLEAGVTYVVNATASPPGVYYPPDFRQ